MIAGIRIREFVIDGMSKTQAEFSVDFCAVKQCKIDGIEKLTESDSVDLTLTESLSVDFVKSLILFHECAVHFYCGGFSGQLPHGPALWWVFEAIEAAAMTM